MNDMQFSDREEQRIQDLEDLAEEKFLQAIADAEYDEFYEQERERDERAREKAKEEQE